MFAFKSLSSQFAAVAAALALTVGMFNNTLAVPQSSSVSTAYVGEIA